MAPSVIVTEGADHTIQFDFAGCVIADLVDASQLLDDTTGGAGQSFLQDSPTRVRVIMEPDSFAGDTWQLSDGDWSEFITTSPPATFDTSGLIG